MAGSPVVGPGPGSADADAMLAALRERGDRTVDRLLRENDPHWRSLSDADRRTVESLARAVAARLLDRPASRLAAERGGAEQAVYARTLCELFALGRGRPRRSPSPRRTREPRSG